MYIIKLADVNRNNMTEVGGKAANLGELCSLGVKIPRGFCITFDAYHKFVEENNINPFIQLFMNENRKGKLSLTQCSEQITNCFLNGSIPNELSSEIIKAYRKLGKMAKAAIRSSANAEDLQEFSFAGQQETFLNISEEENVFMYIKKCWASLWSERAMDYRRKSDFNSDAVYLAVIIQEMIEPDVSGVLFTYNPIQPESDEVFINASYGLGEAVVSGMVTPDTYIYDMSKKKIIYRNKGNKEFRYVNGKLGIEKVQNSKIKKNSCSLNRFQVHKLVKICKRIEKYFGFPQDIEWGIKGNRVYILQSRPITSDILKKNAQ